MRLGSARLLAAHHSAQALPMGPGGGRKDAAAWDCKATSLCGAKGNYGWRTCCRSCQRLPSGQPSKDPTRSPTERVPQQQALRAEVAVLKKQLEAFKPPTEPDAAPEQDDDEVAKLEPFYAAAVAAFGKEHPEAQRVSDRLENARRRRREAKPLRTRAAQAEKKLERCKKAAEAAAAKESDLRTALDQAVAASLAAKEDVEQAERELLALRTAALEEAGGQALPPAAPEAGRALFPKGATFTPEQACLLEQVACLLVEGGSGGPHRMDPAE